MVTTYVYAENFDDFGEQLRETWDLKLGYQLVDIEETDDNAWTGVFVGDSRGNAFEFEESFTALEEKIKVRQDEGYDLVDLDYVDDTWTAVFDQNFFTERGSNYSKSDSLTGFAEMAEEQWSKGLSLSNVEYADGNWISVYRQDLTQTAYSTRDSLTDFKSAVTSRRGEGFDLIGVEYAEDTWVGVFGKDPYNSTKYAIAEDTDEFLEKFELRREQGYSLIDYEQVDDDLLFGIYEKPDSGLSGINELQDRLALVSALI